MAEGVADVIDKGTRALPVVSSNLLTVLVLLLFLGCGLLVWRDEVRADAQIAVLQSMDKRIGGMEQEQRDQHAAFVAAGIHVKASREAE